MNILHVDEQDTWRGGEQQASWLMEGLAARGHQVFLAARPGSAFHDAEHGGVVAGRLAVPLRNEVDFFSAWCIARYARARSIDIFHAHTSHAHMIACFARRLAGRGRVVVSRRVSFPPKDNPFNRWKYSRPDMIVAVSGKVGQVLRDFGIPEARRTVVHSAIDPARLDVPPLPRAELGVAGGAPLLVSAGALVGHKDHETLIKAMPTVLTAFPDARLLIAGEGVLRPAIESHISDLGLSGAVRLLGHRTDVPRLIRAADLYVSSSWSEGLGTSVLEALACQTPVVATVAGGVPEMVIHGETGRLVPARKPHALAQAIIASLHDREAARAMAVRGRALVEDQFVVARMVEGNIRVYERLLGMNRP